MATKFITIRIPIPYIRLNSVTEEKQSYASSDDFAARILEIQTRIATLRSSLRRTEKSYKNTQTQSKPMVDSKAQQKASTGDITKQKELEDIKAKLLRKK